MPRVSMFGSMDVSGSALSAQRARLNAIAKNIANAGTTKTETGEPYRRLEVVLESVPEKRDEAIEPAPLRTGRDVEAALGAAAGSEPGADVQDPFATAAAGPFGETPETAAPVSRDVPGGVRVAGFREDPTEFPKVYDPSHPDADEEGFVTMPNVNMINEMVDMMMASRAYEANLASMNTSKDLLLKTLTIGKQ